MDIKIDESGSLYLKRGKEWKRQKCPFTPTVESTCPDCGDWCPLFGEPDMGRFVPAHEINGHKHADYKSDDTIEICRKTMNGTIIDERPKDEKARP